MYKVVGCRAVLVNLPVQDVFQWAFLYGWPFRRHPDRYQGQQSFPFGNVQEGFKLFFAWQGISFHPTGAVPQGGACNQHVLDGRGAVLQPPARIWIDHHGDDCAGLSHPFSNNGKLFDHGLVSDDDEIPRLAVAAGGSQSACIHDFLQMLTGYDLAGELPDTPAFLNGFECFHKHSCCQYITKVERLNSFRLLYGSERMDWVQIFSSTSRLQNSIEPWESIRIAKEN